MLTLSPERITEAYRRLDSTFRDSPLVAAPELGKRLGVELSLKVETLNPIKSFKGRGAEWFVSELEGRPELVCGSAGNFGQGLAYAARRRGLRVTVFAALNANPVKVERMRDLGAEVVLAGADFDAAKEAAASYARERGARFVEDGREPAIAEGAGTLALELTQSGSLFDVVLLPLGNGALACGVGCWLKARSPSTRVIGVVATGAPSMARSFAAGRVVETATVATAADGIAVRVPIPEAVEALPRFVDEVLEVSEEALLTAMREVFGALRLVVEPAGVAGLAALFEQGARFAGLRIASPLCGGNVSPELAAQAAGLR